MASIESNNQDAESNSIAEPHQNVLQKLASFFDRNQDGVVYPWETFRGLRAIGCCIFLSAAFSLFIDLVLNQKTRPGKCPSLLLPVEVRNIQRGKHGSESGVYDSQGRVANYAEWRLLYYLCKAKNGLLHKETVRAVYDGTLFHQMEKEHSSNTNL